MRTATDALMAEWIDAFGEPPAVADAELMTALLAEQVERQEAET